MIFVVFAVADREGDTTQRTENDQVFRIGCCL